MATNFIQHGEFITIVAPANVTSNAPVFAGEIRGIAVNTADSGELVDVATSGVFSLDKVGTDDVALGDAIYWDESEALATLSDDTGNNPKIGVAVEAAGSGVGTVKVRIASF